MRFAAIAGVALFSVSSVRAELITVTYTGTILAAVDDKGLGRLDGKITVGMPWTASFTIASNAPDLWVDTPAEGYRSRYPSATDLVVTIGSHVTISGPVAINIHNEPKFGEGDQWAVYNEPFNSNSLITMTVDGTVYPKITHTLHASGPSTSGAGLTSNLLTIPDVSAGIWNGLWPTLAQSADGLRVYGTLETLNGNVWVHPTPEPAAVVLAIVGAAMLVVCRRRVAVHSQPSRTPNE